MGVAVRMGWKSYRGWNYEHMFAGCGRLGWLLRLVAETSVIDEDSSGRWDDSGGVYLDVVSRLDRFA